jgi:hypothetical protein
MRIRVAFGVGVCVRAYVALHRQLESTRRKLETTLGVDAMWAAFRVANAFGIWCRCNAGRVDAAFIRIAEAALLTVIKKAEAVVKSIADKLNGWNR